jgi:hypothetical protein
MFENRVLRGIFGSTREKETGGWRKLQKRSLMSIYRILVGKPEGKRPLGRPRGRCVDNIKMDLREIGWDGMHRIDLAQIETSVGLL